MWPFGERFPYTDTHELNLDWILKTIKEVSTKFPELEIAINNKLNKAINTGSAGDILVNNGGGIYEWKNYADEYSDIIIEAVNEWLTDHPEATTTVQNNSLTLQKFTDILRYLTIRNQSGVISPVYLGDFILDRNHVTQTVKFFNNKFYVINAKSRELCMSDGNGNGKVRIYNLSTNSLENEIETIVGHGNSIAFDGEYFYICPIWEYELNSETQIKKIYK